MTKVKIMVEDAGYIQATASDPVGEVAVARGKTKAQAINRVKGLVADRIDGPFDWEILDITEFAEGDV